MLALIKFFFKFAVFIEEDKKDAYIADNNC
jgi:hypothetical protein